MNKAWRRQSSAEWAARAVTDLCDKNQAWTTGWRRLRAHSDAHFKEAVDEAAALHARDELFSKHIEPEPAPEDPVEWAMAEASDAEDDAPIPDAPLKPCHAVTCAARALMQARSSPSPGKPWRTENQKGLHLHPPKTHFWMPVKR